jgi:hypothetical protein
MANRNKFSRFNQPVTCKGCGKRTTDRTGGGTELCRRCYDEAGLENEHQDGGHTEPHPDCPMCKGQG